MMRPRSLPRQPGFSPVYARLLCNLLRERGVDLPGLLARAGLDGADVGHGAPWLAHGKMASLIRAARAQCGDPVLALAWAATARESAHGTVGTAILSSRDVRQAIEALCEFSSLRSTVFVMAFHEAAGYGHLELRTTVDLGELDAFLHSAIAMLLIQLLAFIDGALLAQLELALPFDRAELGAPDPHMACAVRFGAPHLCLRIPVALLDTPCTTAEPEAYEAAVRQCRVELHNEGSGMAARVAGCLARQTDGYPTLAQVAVALAISPRSLSRALAAEGSSFQALLDQARQFRLQPMLVEARLSVEQMAERLGYADPSNFIRAFRRWYGVTPRQYRAAQTPGGAKRLRK